EYAFNEEQIPVVDNLISFNQFTIKGVNKNPLYINGTVDIASLASPKIDLTLKANEMQLVNTNKARKGADIYGKAFISLDSRVHGDFSLLFVNADLRIMPPTNVTYVISDATNALASQATGDMVKFVNFTDSVAVLMADSITDNTMSMILDASLTIENGTTIGVNLSADGKNRVQLEADGTLDYTMSPVVDGRMTGRLNINNGYVRYSPPLMSEKNFAFDNNSYVAFNGDMMNPTLNIHATDVIKANVTQTGQNSRLVNFDVMLNVTGSLDRMDVSFDLATEDDMTVANELQSMSPDQRANQAMNMLLYGIYTGPGTKGDASISGNALYSFLESQINSWAANNIKGVDISFGINQYDRTVDGSSSQTTSYSYQVSKSLFNDRFKIVIGGNYSTDANVDENFSQNLINDISFDYFLNRGHTMYVRIFRHTGYESILEGEITQTGVGFVYRKKLNQLGDMFKFLKPRHKKKNENAENK
ncbi:MAG: translocation/assembly module TamB, partial [Muribaculaceae bacterium]|nr:translocation/assembly module TamB [Muribaculaceae bacterium]